MHPFCVNVLSLDQEPVARYFAGDPDWESEVQWEQGEPAPRLVGVLAWMECPWDRYEAGHHTLYLGEVVAFGHSEGEALGFFSSRFVPISRPMPSQLPLPDYPFELDFDTWRAIVPRFRSEPFDLLAQAYDLPDDDDCRRGDIV